MASHLPLALAAVLVGTLLSAGLPVTGDHTYEQPVQFYWDTLELDVLVLVDEDDAVTTSIRQAIDAWRAGIQAFGPPWLAGGHTSRVYIPALDPMPPPGYNDPEIVWLPPGGAATWIGSVTCIVNAPLPGELATIGPSALFRVSAHEFGHCLGLDHVFEHGVEYHPAHDLMGNGRDWACPSNLNIRVLERVYSAPPLTFDLPTLHIPASAYTQLTDC